MESELSLDVMRQIVFGMVLIVPLWNIFMRTGLKPFLSLLIFVPYVGFVIVGLVLAFSRWPNIEKSDLDSGGKQ